MNRDVAHCRYILASIEEIAILTERRKDLFLNDRKTFLSTLRLLQTLSESASKISVELKARFPKIPWKKIAGLRNILVHDYLGESISPELVWGVIESGLPDLEDAMRAELSLTKS